MIYGIITENDKYIKIGYINPSTLINDRLLNLQIGNPYKLRVLVTFNGDKQYENLRSPRKKAHDFSRGMNCEPKC